MQDDDRARGISQADFRGILGAQYAPPFSDERWLDIRSPKTRAIMAKRFDFAKEIGCDGIDPDNTQANEVRRQCTGEPMHRWRQGLISIFLQPADASPSLWYCTGGHGLRHH